MKIFYLLFINLVVTLPASAQGIWLTKQYPHQEVYSVPLTAENNEFYKNLFSANRSFLSKENPVKIRLNQQSNKRISETNNQFLLDSTIAESFNGVMDQLTVSEKDEYYYDDVGNELSDEKFKLDSANNWVKSSIAQYTYDDLGNQLTFLHRIWDSDKNNWINSMKSESTYDLKGNETFYADYYWDSDSNLWLPNNKYETAYDENGNWTLNSSYDWDGGSNSWIGGFKQTQQYDVLGRSISWSDYDWDYSTNQWVGTDHQTNNYSGDQLLGWYSYRWDSISMDWIQYEKWEYVYDSNGTQIGNHIYSKNNTSGDWILTGRNEFELDEKNRFVQSIQYVLDTVTGEWTYDQKEIKNYDRFGNDSIWGYYNWDASSNQWIGNYQYEYVTDQNGIILSNTFYSGWDNTTNNWGYGSKTEKDYTVINGVYHTTRLAVFYWDSNNARWLPNYKKQFEYDDAGNNTVQTTYYPLDDEHWYAYERKSNYYSELTTTAVLNFADNFKIYPNPAHDYINIELKDYSDMTLELYNSSGTKVLIQSIKAKGSRVNLSGVNSGMYILRISDQTKAYTQKIVVL